MSKKKSKAGKADRESIYNFLLDEPTEGRFRILILFMLRVVETFIDRSPEISKKYFSIAKGYWVDEAIDLEHCLKHKREIREYLLAVNGVFEWEDPTICNIKSVLSLFSFYKKEHPDNAADIFDTFVELVENWIEEEKLLELMEESFGKLL